jgi:uncharacterized protein
VKHLWAILLVGLCLRSFGAEVMPPAPAQYFNDYAQVVSPATVGQLNRTLEDFERQTSEQIVVAIYPKMQSESSIEDYTERVARSWQVGQKGKNNGAVLFVFVQDHSLFVEVGYGLEGVLPDALCKRIIDEQITPRLKNGDFDGGLTAGVQSILAATKGEYQGTGRTVNEEWRGHLQEGKNIGILVFIIIIFALSWSQRSRGRGVQYWGTGWTGGSGGGFGGGGFGGGGGGGGGFSGGGGSFGGGGAGGRW